MKSKDTAAFGTLYLLPAPLGEENFLKNCSKAAVEICHSLSNFVAENAKTARAILKRYEHPSNLREISIFELHKNTSESVVQELLQPIFHGKDIGLLSEAGVPCVADPGAMLVSNARKVGSRVVPLVGASSILLSLMASGLNGQSFEFLGYLPKEGNARNRAIKRIESESKERGGQTKIFIETPYRTKILLEALVSNLNENTLLCVAGDLLQQNERIETREVAEWKESLINNKWLDDMVQCVFLLQAHAASKPVC